jgi:hypothetical protein
MASKLKQGAFRALMDMGSRFSYTREAISDLAQKHFVNKLRNQKRFDAIVLRSDLINAPLPTKITGDSNAGLNIRSPSIWKVYVRPLDIHDFLVPEPCKFKDKNMQEYCISLHPIAMSDSIMQDGTSNYTLNPGDIVSCRYLKGPDNPNGMVGLRFDPRRVGVSSEDQSNALWQCDEDAQNTLKENAKRSSEVDPSTSWDIQPDKPKPPTPSKNNKGGTTTPVLDLSNVDVKTLPLMNAEKYGLGAKIPKFDEDKALTYADTYTWEYRTLFFVIARGGKSKKFNHVVALDGGTVGIAHYASGGLNRLYKVMNEKGILQSYLGYSLSHLKDHDCRQFKAKEPWKAAGYKKRDVYFAAMEKSGSTAHVHKGKNDKGQGCYSDDKWKTGMKKFCSEAKNNDLQVKAWMLSSKPSKAYELAKKYGWTTEREHGASAAISNSSPKLSQNLTTKANGNIEHVMALYGGPTHQECDLMNAAGVKPNDIPKEKRSSSTSEYYKKGKWAANGHRIRRIQAINRIFPKEGSPEIKKKT